MIFCGVIRNLKFFFSRAGRFAPFATLATAASLDLACFRIDTLVSVNGIFSKATLRCFPANRPSLRSLLSIIEYKIDNNS